MAGTSSIFHGSSRAGIPRDAVQVIPGKLYFFSCPRVPKDTNHLHFFSIDNCFQYEPFFSDFGPLNLGCIYKYTRLLEEKVGIATPSHREA